MASSKAVTTSAKVQNGLLPTPPMPAGLPKANLTDNARQVLMKRYVRRGDDGQPAETVEEMFWRVAYHVAKVEEQWDADVQKRTVEYYHLLSGKKFFPNSPTFTGAGTPLGQLAACFVLPITDDMGRDSAGIFQTLRDAALIQQTGGGNGFSFSRLRPKGAIVQTSAGQATGPVGFLRVYDHAFGEIAQGGCLLPETLVFTNKGLLRLDEIVNSDMSGWQEHVLSVPTDEGLKGSPRGYNNGVAPTLRVQTREGITLGGTPNHKVKVMTAEGPAWRRLEQLQPGDAILMMLGQHSGRLQALRQVRLDHHNQIAPILPPVLDEEMAFFLGYLTGDGMFKGNYGIGLVAAEDSYLVEEMPRLIRRLFGNSFSLHEEHRDNAVYFTFSNRAIREFLVLNGVGKPKSSVVHVPRLIRQSPPEVVGAFLRGLFEADGTLSHGYPELQSASERLIREVATLLIGLGCPVSICRREQSIGSYSQTPMWSVRIKSFLGLQNWRKFIGCDGRSRFASCYGFQPDLRRESSYILPYPKYWLEPVLDATRLPQIDKRHRGDGLHFRSESPQLRRRLLRYTRGDRRLTLSGYELLAEENSEFAEHLRPINNLWFIRVTSVEYAGESLTLDLEVEDNHTYLANGCVSHNTRRGANMAVLRVDHPDVEDFIVSKTNENHITNFNISVGITDAFMRALKEDGEWELRFPDIAEMKEHKFSGTLEQAEKEGITIREYRKVKARELFNKIVKQAHHNGEPGVLFLDAANRTNPVPHLYQLEATNPCFVGSTRITTDLGLLTIQELAESEAVFMVANDQRAPQSGSSFAGSSYGVVYRASSPAWKTRENVQTFRLTTKHGYEVIATPDHKFLTTDNGYVELGKLKEGDTLLLQSSEGVWSRNRRLPNVEALLEKMSKMAQGGDRASGHTITRRDFVEQYANLPVEWSHEIGVILGTLVGDGGISPNSGSPVGMVFNAESDELLDVVHGTMRSYFGEGHLHQRGSLRQLTYGRVPLEFFVTLGVKHVRAHEKRVPDAVWQAPREAIVGFLQGLFTTDGTVNISSHKKSCSIRLASSSVEMLRDVQLLLLNFGIVSRIHKRREAGRRDLPDGKGGLKEYFTQADYELIIDKANRDKFIFEIGFLDSVKQAKAINFISSKTRISNSESFETTVVAIEEAGYADVYDLTEPQTHSVIANGVVAHQCGEQYLGSYENCCLGSVNLNEHCGPDGTVDWESLRQSVVLATKFLDDVVESNAYVPAVSQLKEAAHRARRIGLGIMGLADLMYHVGVRYGSQQGQEFGAQVMEFVRYHAMKTSIELAEERGPFPAIEGSIYDMDNLTWTPPQSLIPLENDWSRPEVQWDAITDGIRKHGIRNAAQTTVAPTGTIATVAGCEGYGCEPVFALAYIRHVNDNGRDLKLTYASPRFDEALRKTGLGEEKRQEIVEQVMRQGTCQQVKDIPQPVRDVFVVSADITAEEHVRMQAALQAFVDNSLSKCVTGDTLVLTANGLMPISAMSDMRLPDQFEEHDIAIVSPAGIERSDSFYYGGMRETRRVTLAHGFEVEGTPNHRVHVLQADGRVDFKRLDDLKIGDEVLLYMGQQVFGPEAQPLPAFTGEFRTDAKKIRFPLRMSPEFAYLLGCITSEGSIGENSIQICNGDRALLEHLGKMFEELFGLNSHIVQDVRRASVFSLQVHSRPLRNWLLNDLGLEAGARNKIIPNCILRAGRNEIAAFLRGLFLDAYMTLDGRMFGIGLASRRLLRQLQTLLLNFGVFSMIHKSAEHAWVLNVSGEALELLASFVEFVEVWKNERIEIRNEGRVHLRHNYATLMPESVTTNLRQMQETAPESLRSLFGELPRACGTHEREYQRARVNLLQGHRLERALARRIYDYFKDYATPFAQQFFSTDQPGILYVKVQRVETGFSEVFDISVPGSHSFIANGMGNHNTVNFPETATEEDVAKAYMLAWELGCKGITVYVTGSREKVVLETKATAEKKVATAGFDTSEKSTRSTQPAEQPKPEIAPTFSADPKRPRPRVLSGKTYSLETPAGKAFITINENGGEQPFEAFINTAKAGSETAAVSEAIGRLISYILRMSSPTQQTDRLREVVRQLGGIGGGRSLGMGANRVRSLPDGIGQVLDMYLREKAGALPVMEEKSNGNSGHQTIEEEAAVQKMKIGDLCPECGEAAVVNEEGCRKCYACGFSEC